MYSQAGGAAFCPPHLLFLQTKIVVPPQLKAAPLGEALLNYGASFR